MLSNLSKVKICFKVNSEMLKEYDSFLHGRDCPFHINLEIDSVLAPSEAHTSKLFMWLHEFPQMLEVAKRYFRNMI